MAAAMLSACIIIFSLTNSSHDTIAFSNGKTDSPVISIKNAYGFTYNPTNNNRNLTLDKYEQIRAIQNSGLSFPEYIHQLSMGAGNPKNASAITDYKAMQKHMEKIEKLINGCDIKKDFIINSDDALDLCMDQSSFVYETCAGDHNIYAPICNNAIIENILKTTKPSPGELNRRAYDEAKIYVPLD